MSLPEISAKHPVSVIMLYIAIAVSGIISLIRLEINMFPDISIPKAYIVTECNSMSAEDIEKMITEPVENSLSSVSGIKEISSISREALSTVKLLFEWNENIDKLSGEIREKIDTVYPVLPFESNKPLILFSGIEENPLITLAIIPASGRSISEVSRIIETDFKSRLLAIEGVSEIRLSGLVEDEIKIDVDYPSLVNTGLSLDAVTSAVSSSVFSRPAGKIYKGNKEFRVRAETDVKTVADIKDIPLFTREGLKISDIAEIYTGEKDSSSYFHSKGRKCIGIEIIRTGNSGLINTAERIRNEMENIETIFKNDFSVSFIDDSSVELKKTLKSLFAAVAAGAAAALIVLFIFFKSIKTSFTVIISLPVSLTMVFTYMYFSKISLNLISITGLIIGIGMVFDNTIVVVDKLISDKPEYGKDTGRSVSENILSVTGSTLTTILIFLPLVFISGITGKVFKDLAFTVIALVGASAVVAITLPPAFYTILKMRDCNTLSIGVSKLKNNYSRYLSGEKVRTDFLLFLFLIPLLLIVFIDKEIVPPGYGKKVSVFAEYLPGYSSDYYSEKSLLIERMLIENGIAEKVHVRGGVNKKSPEDIKDGSYDINTALFTIKGKFKGSSRKYEAYIEQIISDVMNFYSLKRVEVRSNDSFLDRITRRSKSLQCVLSDRDKSELLLKEIEEKLNEEGCIKSITGNYIKDNPEYTLLFDKEGFASSALTPFDTLLYNTVKGSKAASLDTGREIDTDILVRYKRKYTESAEKISSLKIPLKDGVFDPSSFTEIIFKNNYRYLTRLNRKSCLYLNIVPVSGMEDKSLSILRKYRMSGLEIPSLKEKEDNRREIILLFISALLLIYFFLGAQFESFLIPLFLMLSIPLSVSGSFILLYLTNQSLNISSFLGILILTGTTVNTAIMIFADKRNSIKISAEKRVVPAAAAILTTVAALIPAAIQIKSPLQSSSAAALIGGLVSGGIAVLLIYPFMFEDNKRVSGRKSDKFQASGIISDSSLESVSDIRDEDCGKIAGGK